MAQIITKRERESGMVDGEQWMDKAERITEETYTSKGVKYAWSRRCSKRDCYEGENDSIAY